MVKNCSLTSIVPVSANLAFTFVVNDPTLSNTLSASDFAAGDPYCLKRWEVSVFDGDQNGNGQVDPSECTVLPTAGSASGSLFYKSSDSDASWNLNTLKPIVNSDSKLYTLRTRLFFDSALSNEVVVYMTVNLIADCSVETLTSSPISDILYTFRGT